MRSPEQNEAAPGKSPKKLRLARFVFHPVQYLVPLYRGMCRTAHIHFTVYFYSDSSLGKHFDAEFGREFEWSTSLLGGYNHRFLPSTKGNATNNAFAWPDWDLL